MSDTGLHFPDNDDLPNDGDPDLHNDTQHHQEATVQTPPPNNKRTANINTIPSLPHLNTTLTLHEESNEDILLDSYSTAFPKIQPIMKTLPSKDDASTAILYRMHAKCYERTKLFFENNNATPKYEYRSQRPKTLYVYPPGKLNCSFFLHFYTCALTIFS